MAELGQGLFLGDKPVQLIQNNNFVSTNPFYFDSDAYAFLQAAQITDQTTVFAINNLVIDLKDAGLWDKFYALYPFVGGTASTQKWNLKDPRDLDAAYRLTFSGGLTHNSDGIQSNGTSGYYDTNMAGTTLSQDNVSIFVYIRNNVAEEKVDIGYLRSAVSPFTGLQINSRSSTNVMATRCHTSNPAGVSSTPSGVTSSIGVFGMYRDNSANYVNFINKSETTRTNASVAPDASKIYGLCFNLNLTAGFFSTRQQALAGIGTALSTSLVSDLVDINQTFQTALGRFV
jgi:hypothetical protein